MATLSSLYPPTEAQELCSLGTLPNSQFTLTPGVHYWLTQAFSCDGYVSRVQFHYRGGSEDAVMNLSVSVWSASGGSSYSLQGERVIAVAALEDTFQYIQASYSFSMYDEPILMVSENDYVGFSFNSSLTNSGNQEPLLGARFSFLTRYNRYEGIRGDTVDTSSFMDRGGRIGFSVDVGVCVCVCVRVCVCVCVSTCACVCVHHTVTYMYCTLHTVMCACIH